MSVTLADVERELARRTGPFEQFVASSINTSTQTLVYVDDLATTLDVGGIDGLWLLRRNAASAADRQRLIKEYSPNDGTLEVDRAYAVAPASGEALEVMALDPTRRIRVAVQRGLDRCFAEDRVQVIITATADERDLTAALPWVTRKGQVLGAAVRATSTSDAPASVNWFRPFEKGGRVWLHAWADPYPDDFFVSALRPVSSRINGLSAPPCPTIDDVATGGALHADTVYHGATAVVSAYGTSPACPPVRFYPATAGANIHVGRFHIPQDPDGRHYHIYLSTAVAPLRVATITEAQRAAGVTITAQDTISATSPGADCVDVQVVGSSTAAVQAAAPALDADVLDVALDYAATAAHAYAWEVYKPDLAPLVAMGMGTPEADVRKGWKVWIARLPSQPDRVQTAYPWPAAAPSSWYWNR